MIAHAIVLYKIYLAAFIKKGGSEVATNRSRLKLMTNDKKITIIY